MTKGKSLRGFWRRIGRRSKTSHACLLVGNVAYSGVHLTHLISKIVETTTKVNLHPLNLLYDGLKGHTTSHRRRRSGSRRSWQRGWNNKSCRIGFLHLWPLQSKLSLTPLDGANANGNHDGKGSAWKPNERWAYHK